MCDPATMAVAAGAMSIGQAYVGYEQAKGQSELQDYQYEQNKLNSLSALRNNYQTTQQRQMQEIEAAAQQVDERRREALQKTATARVAAGEAGVSGLSVESVLRDISGSAARDVATINQNRDWSLAQLNQQMRGQQAQAKSRINSVLPGQPVDALPFLIQGAAGATQAGMNYQTMTK